LKDSLEHATDALADVAAKLKRTVEKKRSHRLRNMLFVAGAAAVAATGAVVARRRLRTSVPGMPQPTSVDAAVDVGVPVTVAYNQWTQFEEFPQFMEGVDEVKQLDDTLLHWAATIAGRRAEWDAQIIEQEPDRRITWESVDGKRTRGTVTFETKGPERSRVRLHMSYQPDGVAEQVGSAMGLDSRRIHGDLARFRELVEGRQSATGAWRGEVHDGEKKKA
jgi:uncharacterized membrane protein